LATYSHLLNTSMPNGWLRPPINTLRSLKLPSPLLPRSMVMRLALPLMFSDLLAPIIAPPIFLGSLKLLLVSATSRSPLGVMHIHRGLSKPSAYLVTVNPAGAFGVSPLAQPTTSLKFFTDFVAYGWGRLSTAIVCCWQNA